MSKADLPPRRLESYQKARKSYGLVAGLLLAWELVGVELQSSNLPFSLQSPDAAPLVLLALVVYFGIRLTIEWHHLHPARRDEWVSRIDYFLAHVIGFGAIAIFTIQVAIDQQIFNLIFTDETQPIHLLAIAGFSLGSMAYTWIWLVMNTPVGLLKNRFEFLMVVLLGVFATGIFFFLGATTATSWSVLVLWLIGGVVAGAVVAALMPPVANLVLRASTKLGILLSRRLIEKEE